MKIDSRTMINRAGRYGHIDALRAIAVMLVVVAHTDIGGIPGGSGVTMFFAVSGFIITHLAIRERETTGRFSVGGFYFRRAAKLAPPLLLIILIPTAIYAIAGNPISVPYVATQTFFVFNWAMIYEPFGTIFVLPGSSVVWSLAIEEQFYIAFAFAFFFASRSNKFVRLILAMSLATIATSSIVRFALAADPSNSFRIYLGTDTRADAIAIGMLAAVAYHRIQAGALPRTRTVLSSPFLLAMLPILYLVSIAIRDDLFRDTIRYTIQAGVAALFIIWGLLDTTSRTRLALDRILGLPLVQTIGLASYSIYLVHAPLNEALQGVLASLPASVAVPTKIMMGCTAGVMIWWAVERPVEKWRRRRSTDPSSRSATATGTEGSATAHFSQERSQ